jgi:hypothetical protein
MTVAKISTPLLNSSVPIPCRHDSGSEGIGSARRESVGIIQAVGKQPSRFRPGSGSTVTSAKQSFTFTTLTSRIQPYGRRFCMSWRPRLKSHLHVAGFFQTRLPIETGRIGSPERIPMSTHQSKCVRFSAVALVFALPVCLLAVVTTPSMAQETFYMSDLDGSDSGSCTSAAGGCSGGSGVSFSVGDDCSSGGCATGSCGLLGGVGALGSCLAGGGCGGSGSGCALCSGLLGQGNGIPSDGTHCGLPAPKYPVPFATPRPTTPTHLMYPPMMPHNSLPHYRSTYSFKHGPGMSRTNVHWRSKKLVNVAEYIHHLFELPR